MSHVLANIAKPVAPRAHRAGCPDTQIAAAEYLSPVYKHLTKALCDSMVWFWIGLLQGRFGSQTRAILEAGSGNPLLPRINASPESFFQKIQNVRPTFFREVFRSFTEKVEVEYEIDFAVDLPKSCDAFAEVYAVDASRLAKVGRLLRATRNVTKAIIPGSMQAIYDLRRGHLRDLWFDADGHQAEITMWEHIRGAIVQGTLVLADRYYAKPCIWRQIEAAGAFMLTRHNKVVKHRKVERLSKIREDSGNVDEWLVDMGGSDGTQPVRLRMLRVWGPSFRMTLLTNVLESSTMSAWDAVKAYRRRWRVERMYLAMKDVLDLNRLYNCSPAAVGQQVYATAILYNALRLAQSKVGQFARICPARLSEQRLFPVLIGNFIKMTYMQLGADRLFAQIQAMHTVPLKRPDILYDHPTLAIRAADFLVETRSNKRRKRRFCVGRKGHTAFGKIPGTKCFIKS
jgi:hypothetical protein